MPASPSKPNPRPPALQRLEDRLTPASAAALESVTNLYRLSLNRLPEPGGLAHFANRLDSGEPVAAITTSLLASAEHREKIVTGYYHGILGRAPDSAGLASQVAALGRGVSEEQLVAGMLASAEKSGALTDTAFVDLLYQSILDRAPDSGGHQANLGALAAGTSRQSLALAFLESREAATTVVDNLYTQLLGRTPAVAEKQGWISALARPDFSYADAVTRFTASPEGSARLATVSPLVGVNQTNLFFWQQRLGLNNLGGAITVPAPAPFAYFLDANPITNSGLTPSGYAVVIDGSPSVRDPIADSGRLTGVTVEFAGGVDGSHVSWASIQKTITQWTGDITSPEDRQTLATNILTAAMDGPSGFANFPTKAEAQAANGNLIWAQDFEAHINPQYGQGSTEEIAAGILAVSWAGREILGDSMKIVPVPASAVVKGPPALGAPWNLGTVLTDSTNYLGKLQLVQTMPQASQSQISTMDLLSALHLITAGGQPLIDGILIQQYGATPPGTPSADTPPFTDTGLPYAVMSSLYDPPQLGNPKPPTNPWPSYYFGDMPFTAGIYWSGNSVVGTSGFDPTQYLTPTLATTTWDGKTPTPANPA